MLNLISLNGISPKISESAWVADNAIISGDVTIGEGSSIWFQVVIRGDVNKIRIGNNTNIQDHSMVHGSTGGIDTVIGDGVTIGHRAIIHGCTINDDVLIGMGAIVLDEVTVESNVIVAAGAVVTGGQVLESGFLYAGIPAKKIKAVTPKMIQEYIIDGAQGYVKNKELYRK